MNSKGDWELKLRKVRNGFIIEYEDQYDDDEGFKIRRKSKTFKRI